jgi:phytoene/squalene synthetase
MADTASDHFEKAKTAIARLPKSIRPVFLQIMLAQPLLKQIMTDPSKCFSTHISLSALKRQWHAFRGLSRL